MKSAFVEQLTTELEPAAWLWQRIEEYDQNIAEYEHQLAENREEDIRLKYFQYLSLLFTEIYLDLYYNYEEKLQEALMCSILLISESRFDSVFECFSTGFSEEFAA